MALILPATVVTAAPLTIAVDGDPVNAIPALTASSYTPVVDDRVRVEVRAGGLQPFVLGKVT